jgi:hypothetical protein
MQTTDSTPSMRQAFSYFFASAAFAVVAASAQVGVIGDTGIDTSGNHQQEVAWCMDNTVGDEQAACLKDSGAARAEKREGTLDKPGENYRANAMRRCDDFAGDDRIACRARVQGQGSSSGTVQGGGVIKKIETIIAPAVQ